MQYLPHLWSALAVKPTLGWLPRVILDTIKMEQQDDYEKVKRKRKFEIFCFLSSSLVIITIAICYLFFKRAFPFSCSPSAVTYMKDITDADDIGDNKLRTVDGMIYPPRAYWVSKNGSKWGCPCLLKPCIHSCCGKGQNIELTKVAKNQYKKNCVKDDWRQEDLHVFSMRSASYVEQVPVQHDHFYVIDDKFTCRSNSTKEDKERKSNLLLEDGSVFRGGVKNHVSNYTTICVGPSADGSGNSYRACLHGSSSVTGGMWLWKGVGMLVSVPCLVLTLLVHVLLPPLFNMHGKALVCHLACLTVTYTTLAAMNLGSFRPPEIACISIGFIIQISALASFFWLNVMCFDIWWVFSGLMPRSGFRKAAEQLKFRLYSLYAWGCPLAIAALTLLLMFLPWLPSPIVRPRIGLSKCLFHERDASILYLYLPLGVLVYLNTVMFVITAVRLRSHTRGGTRLNSTGGCRTGDNRLRDNLNRFAMFGKLSAVMGLNWILEIMSLVVAPEAAIWCVTDIANALVGVAMLYLFVFKRRVLIMLNEKLCPNRNIVSREETSGSGESGRQRNPTCTALTETSTDHETKE